ncbi:MAG TPA: metallophosphoesterase family protein [Gaiellaceae bacterium]
MLIAQLSDVHVGAARHRRELLHAAIAEVNDARPDLVVVAGDLTDDGFPEQYDEARGELARIECEHVVLVPGNHDARNVGYILYEETFGTRDHRLRVELDGMDVALVAVDASKPDIDEGEVGREHYGWIAEGFDPDADLRIFVCHHHLVPIPGTGRERNQLLDAGDVLSLLHESKVDLVLGGHRHVPYVWPIAGLYVVHSGTVSTLRTRGFGHPSYNMVRIGADEIQIERRLPGAAGDVLGAYPRRWPKELAAMPPDSFVRRGQGQSLADA